MAVVEAQSSVFDDVFETIRILEKHNIDFDIEKEGNTFTFKTETSETFTIDLSFANEAVLKETFVDFFVLTKLYQFTTQVDWVNKTLEIQFIVSP